MNPHTSTKKACPAPASGGLIWRRWLALAWCFSLVLALLPGISRAAADFLPPEQAFQVTARADGNNQAVVDIRITKGYYLYRQAFKFSATGASVGEVTIPPGKVKFDENFQKEVETYRDHLQIRVPVSGVNGPYRLSVVSQGCADAGLCYPPMTTEVSVDPAAATASTSPQTAAPAQAGAAAGRTLAESWRAGSVVDDVLQGGRLWQAVGVFFVIGVLLSFTPCVLPMLPILSSLIVGTQGQPSRLRGLGLASSYALGMALVYTALGVAAGLAGEGLAASLQTPWVIGAFALLLALFSLSMFDVYELRLPSRFTSKLTTQCNRLPAGQVAGVFMMGGVSALIVSPCVTAPLAGALLFISQSRDLVLGGSALFSMAVGMSVPLLVLGASSGRWLPRSGPWMYAVKRFFGLLMLAVALWVAQPVLPIWAVMVMWGVLLLLLGFMLQPFAARAGHRHPMRHALQRAVGLGALGFGLMQLVGAASGAHDPLRPLAQLGDGAASQAALPSFKPVHSVADLEAALRQAGGKPVMLDFYADWCVSCKEMERFTFSDADVAARMSRAVLLKADVTANTEAERELLRRFKLFGPPGTLFFDAQGRELADARVVGFQSARRFQRTLDSVGL